MTGCYIRQHGRGYQACCGLLPSSHGVGASRSRHTGKWRDWYDLANPQRREQHQVRLGFYIRVRNRGYIRWPCGFESMAGRLVATGRYRGTLLVSGTVTLASAGLIWGTLQPSSGTPGLPIPRPNKPWVREPPGAPTKGGAIGDILLGSQLQAAPAALVDQLQRQVSSISSLGSVVVDGSAEHEYRLVVRLDGLSKVVAQPTGSLEMLGKAHTFFIWVDGDHRIVKLSTSIAFESPARTATISLTCSRFNIHVTLAVPSDASIESLQQYHEQNPQSVGLPAKWRDV